MANGTFRRGRFDSTVPARCYLVIIVCAANNIIYVLCNLCFVLSLSCRVCTRDATVFDRPAAWLHRNQSRVNVHFIHLNFIFSYVLYIILKSCFHVTISSKFLCFQFVVVALRRLSSMVVSDGRGFVMNVVSTIALSFLVRLRVHTKAFCRQSAAIFANHIVIVFILWIGLW